MKLIYYITVFLFFFAIQQVDAQNFYIEKWREVEQFELQDQIEDAGKIVDEIYKYARRKKDEDQYVKAFFFKSKYQLINEEDAQSEIIIELDKMIQKASFPNRNVYHSIMAKLLDGYARNNQWKIRQRTAVETDDDDFKAWDATKFYNKISYHYNQSLNQPDRLIDIPLSDYKAILGTLPPSRFLRPSLLDLLSHQALDFYNSGYFNITKPKEEFIITDKNGFLESDKIRELIRPAGDTVFSKYDVLQLYAQLEDVHKRNKNDAPYIHILVDRLKYTYSVIGANKIQPVYEQRLMEIIDQYPQNAAVTYAYFNLANYYYKLSSTQSDEVVSYRQKAIKKSQEAIKLFDQSYGGVLSANLLSEIFNPSVNVVVEDLNIPDRPHRGVVTYRNVEKIQIDYLKVSQGFKTEVEFKNDSLIKSFFNEVKANNSITSSYTLNLPSSEDTFSHTYEYVAKSLEKGRYIIFTSHQKGDVLTISTSEITISNLVLFQREIGHNRLEWQVKNRATGKPESGISIAVTLNNDDDKLLGDFYTRRDGTISMDVLQNHYSSYHLTATKKGDTITTDHYQYYNSRKENHKIQRNGKAFLYLDRAIYRPGQPLYFKTIAISDKEGNSQVLDNLDLEIVIRDTNSQVIKTIPITTNEFGSAHGSFEIPIDATVGRFTIQVRRPGGKRISRLDKWINTSYSFQVEEYKRPKFEVDFKKIKETYRLGDSITVTGIAKAFLGSNITGAQVSYKVYQSYNYSKWYRSYYDRSEKMIEQGKTTSNQKGEFEIPFLAIENSNSKSDYKPIYTYRINAEVTDVNGETRTGEFSLRIGHSSIEIIIDTPSILNTNQNEMSIVAKNLNGERVDAKIILEVRKSDEANHPIINSQLNDAEFYQIDDKLFRETFPFSPLRKTEKESDWKKSPVLYRKQIRTDSLKKIKIPFDKNWDNGSYIIYARAVKGDEVFTEENTVEKVENIKLWANPSLPLEPSIIEVTTLIENEDIHVDLFTSMNSAYATLMVWDDKHQISKEEIFIKKGKTRFTYKRKKVRGQSFYASALVQIENGFEHSQDQSQFPSTEKVSYNIKTATFRDKLKPGLEEQWSFILKDNSGNPMQAEVLASMYDKSLDTFVSSYWNAPYLSYYNPTYQPTFPQSLTSQKTSRFYLNFEQEQAKYYRLEYDEIRFFGFNFINSEHYYNNYKRRLIQKRNLLEPRTGYVVGKVTDSSGEPVLGVTIVLKGTSISTITDFDGNYIIKVNVGDRLRFSSVGYGFKEILIKERGVINVALRESLLEEVIIEGYRTVGGYNSLSSPIKFMEVSEENMSPNYRFDAGELVKGEDLSIENKDGRLYDKKPTGWNLRNSNNGIVQDSISQANVNKQLDNIQARKNLQETAFFLPDLRTDEKGNLKFSFTSPEALTQWKLRLLAHNKKAQTAQLEQLVITQKELSVIPNAPRFLRETDTIHFSTKIANLSDATMDGTARLQLFDAMTMKAIDAELGNVNNNKDFTIEKGGNVSVNWTFRIPLGIQAVTYRVVAAAGNFSDGEENTLPVLTNRMLVNESRALWVRAGETKTAVMDNLLENDSGTMAHHQMVFEYTSNPSWYAIKSLPYLMEYEHECAEQTFSRFYANAMAHHILTSNPKVKEVFDSWSQNGTNVSALEKNEELKTVLLSHTPWLRDAQSETEKQQRLATLFDLAKTAKEKKKTLAKLERLQKNSGGFPWFNGGKINEYITRHIAAGLGHIKKLGIKNEDTPQTDRIYKNAIDALDVEWAKRFGEYLKNHKTLEKFSYSNSFWHYLYARSFVVEGNEDFGMLIEARKYAFAQAEKTYSSQPLYTKLLMAITLYRSGKTVLAESIMEGLKQTAVKSDENGMYWKENTNSWYWYSSDIETQALAIEAFQEVINDLKSVEELKIWLLKNKRTNQWKSTKATADATYALLLQGGKWLDVQENNKIIWGNKPLPVDKMKAVEKEAGTGYFKITMAAPEVYKELATVTVKNNSEVTGYGALYWQYFEDLDKIVVDDDLPLSVKKKLFKKVMTDSGEKLEAITSQDPLKIGDLITVRLIIKTNADLDFVHLKDMRASGFEPIDVLSKYKWQDGLGYYQSTKDVATHFFFDQMNKGTYVFEYDVRANNAGQFSNGITQLECMYAPEFSSHSEGIRVKIEE